MRRLQTDAIAIGGAYGDLLNRMASNQPAENIHASALAAQNAVKGAATFDPKVAQNLIDNTTNLIAIAWYLIEGPDSAADALVACSNLFEGLAGLLGLVGALLGGPFTAVAAGLVVACGVVSKLLGDVAKDVTNASGNGEGEREGEGGGAEGGEAEGGHGESIHVEIEEPDSAFDAGISPEELASGRLPSASELIDRSTNRR